MNHFFDNMQPIPANLVLTHLKHIHIRIVLFNQNRPDILV